MLSRLLVAALVAVATTATVRAGESTITIESHQGKWESGYGVKFYNVVGSLKNTGTAPVAWVKLRVEALDGDGAVVATADAYNEAAEALSVPGADAQALVDAGKVTPVAPGATQRFRASFLEEEHPNVASHRVTVAEAPAP